jgi:hypothetical protein
VSAPVNFAAQLMALGDAEGVDLSDYGDQPVLVFVASVEDVRKAAALFRTVARLHSGPLHDAAEDLLYALKRVGCQDADSCGDGEGLCFICSAIAKAEPTP